MHKTNESGRSMVEMLGVLAIMGVLSVGGVAMYSSAMNKHRANEILNELYKRASFVAMRITAGQNADQVSLAEFQQYDDLGYAKFAQGVIKVGENQFKLSLASVPDTSICNQIKASTGTNTSFIAVADNCSAITFNNDLSKTSSSENSSNSSDQNSQNECAGKEDGTACGDGKLCVKGNCITCQPKCKWTEWFDVDYPKYEEGGGDFETYEKIRGAGGAVCKKPIEIECEAENYPGLTPEQVGQRVHCDLETGLICRNEEQLGLFKMCYNYRMRVLCCSYSLCT